MSWLDKFCETIIRWAVGDVERPRSKYSYERIEPQLPQQVVSTRKHERETYNLEPIKEKDDALQKRT